MRMLNHPTLNVTGVVSKFPWPQYHVSDIIDGPQASSPELINLSVLLAPPSEQWDVRLEKIDQHIDCGPHPRRVAHRFVVDDPGDAERDWFGKHPNQFRTPVGDDAGDHADSATGVNHVTRHLGIVDQGYLCCRAAMIFDPTRTWHLVHRLDVEHQLVIR